MKFKKNISLKNYTTFQIGGKAKYFSVVRNKEELVSAIKFAKEKRLPFFILGQGSNLLVSDKGFKGIVIKIENCKVKIENCKVVAGAGVLLSRLVNSSAERGLTGLGWAAGIPGTVGGAVYGNAGAFGKSMKDVIGQVEVLDVKDLGTELRSSGAKVKKKMKSSSPFKTYNLRKCNFGYKGSVFKKKKNLIIISAELKLKKGNKKEIKSRIKEYLNYKKTTQPLNFPSAGSIFKNYKKFFAGELIEKCNLKGKKIGKAKISEKHANFIVNLDGAQAKDVKKLIKLIKKEVKNKFRVVLKEEIEFLS